MSDPIPSSSFDVQGQEVTEMVEQHGYRISQLFGGELEEILAPSLPEGSMTRLDEGIVKRLRILHCASYVPEGGVQTFRRERPVLL